MERTWCGRLGNLRNVVRQHVISAQLADHLGGVRRVLDVGCGQGTQAIALAERGLDVTGVDPSAAMLEQLAGSGGEHGVTVRRVRGSVDELPAVVASERFDLVCAHGLLMYLPDAFRALEKIVEFARPGGRVSFTVRNGDALAVRPAVAALPQSN